MNHVGHERPRQTVKSSGVGSLIVATDDDASGIELSCDSLRKLMRELALRTFNLDQAVFDIVFDALENLDWNFTDARHISPNLAQNLAAHFLRASLMARDH